MTSQKQLMSNRRNARLSTGPKSVEGKLKVAGNAIRHGLLSRLKVLPRLESQSEWDIHFRHVITALRPEGYVENGLAERVALLLWRLGRIARYERDATAIGIDRIERDIMMPHGGSAVADYFPGTDQTVGELLAGSQEEVELAEARLAAFERLRAAADDDQAAQGRWIIRTILLAADLCAADPEGWPDQIGKLLDGRWDEQRQWTAGEIRAVLRAAARCREMGCRELLAAVAGQLGEDLRAARGRRDRTAEDVDGIRRKRALPEGRCLKTITRYESHVERSLYRAMHELYRLQACRQGHAVAGLRPIRPADGTVIDHRFL